MSFILHIPFTYSLPNHEIHNRFIHTIYPYELFV